jgi:hypothetical protein
MRCHWHNACGVIDTACTVQAVSLTSHARVQCAFGFIDTACMVLAVSLTPHAQNFFNNYEKWKSYAKQRWYQCCGSEMFLSRIPDTPIALSRIRIPDPGVKKHRIPDPTYFCIKANNKFCLVIPDLDPAIAPSRIPDPVGTKAPDPRSCIPDPDPQHWMVCKKNFKCMRCQWHRIQNMTPHARSMNVLNGPGGL